MELHFDQVLVEQLCSELNSPRGVNTSSGLALAGFIVITASSTNLLRLHINIFGKIKQILQYNFYSVTYTQSDKK